VGIIFSGSNAMITPSKNFKPGTLDPSFGTDGVLLVPIPEISANNVPALCALPDNKLLAIMPLLGTRAPVVVVRLNEDGTLDTNFGDSGVGYTELPFMSGEDLSGINALADGGALVRFRYPENGNIYSIIIKLRSDGSFNNTFGNNGVVRILGWNRSQQSEGAGSLQVNDEPLGKAQGGRRYSALEDPVGNIVLIDEIDIFGRARVVVNRLKSDGSFDENFNGGRAIVELPGVEYQWLSRGGFAVQSDGRVVATGVYGGDTSRGVFIVRFDNSGSPDAGFNNGAPVVIPTNADSRLSSVAVNMRQDGTERIVLAGHVATGGSYNGFMVVLDGDGYYDPLFNEGQPLYSKFSYESFWWSNCNARNDGSIIAVGFGSNELHDGGTLTACYRDDGTLDSEFNDGQGFVVYAGPDGSRSPSDMADMDDRRIVISGLGFDKNNNWVLRYLG
jgi:uncharacterized delta-60 repeat protein